MVIIRRSRMKTMLHLGCIVVCFFVSSSLFERGVDAFNLDPYSVVIVRPSDVTKPGSYFGFSHAFLSENNETWLIVGAPRANVSWEVGASEPGTVYKCRLANGATKKDHCSELRMDYEPVDRSEYRSYSYNQWLGASMDVSNSDGQLVVCGHRRKHLLRQDGSKAFMAGICFSRNNMKENATLRKSQKVTEGEKLIGAWNPQSKAYDRDIYHLAYAQWGSSVRLSTEGHIVMGGPGSWQWQGGIYVNIDNKVCNADNLTVDDSYLGYSVTSIRRPANPTRRNSNEYMFAGGAPRYKETGRVYIVEIRSDCVNRTVQEIPSTKYGSYFGASILAVDTNADGLDELFVGAPFENLTLGDEGTVYYYSNNGNNYFVSSKVLTGTRQAGGRFGTSIASAGDLNLDGFNDVIIGAPFEDGGHGAIYIFIGNQSGIMVPYSQRIPASDLPEFGSVSSFGYSLSSGRDIDGDKYPDVSIGAYMNDRVAILRARPVHTVTAVIWFPAAVIAWQRPNCSKATEGQTFSTTLTISFFYTIPEQEKQNIKDTFILVDYLNRSASLGADQTIAFANESSPSRLPLKFFVVPCLAKQGNNRCVSFLAAGHRATYMRLFDRNLIIENNYTARNPNSYKEDASFYLSADLGYGKLMSIGSRSMRNQILVSGENGMLTIKHTVEGEQSYAEGYFSFIRGRYLPCIKGLSYALSIDNTGRGHLQNLEGGWISSSVRQNVNFNVENLDEPLNRSWAVVFQRYPKNIAIPMKFQLEISGPSLNASRTPSYGDSNDLVFFDQLSPVLNNLSQKTFDGEIGFYKECGDDDVCDANLSVNMTLTDEHSRGLVIGSKHPLPLYFYVENTGETAYSVHLEIIHPSLFLYKGLSLEDSCNQVTAKPVENWARESANSSMAMLDCDVENQIHANGSLAFKVYLDTINFREESDFPMDFMELQCRIGTDGQIKNGTESQTFQVPIRYEAELEAFGTSIKTLGFNTRAKESTNPAEKTLILNHHYVILNKGPGIMPSVTIDVLLPDDSIYNVSEILDVTVTVSGKRSDQQFQLVINETEILKKPVAITTVIPEENGNRTTNATNKENENAVRRLLRRAIGQKDKTTVIMDCVNASCSDIRRYKIGSMYEKDQVAVNITVAFSAVNLSKIENLLRVNYTTSVRISPFNLSDDVVNWKEGKVKIIISDRQTSTILRPLIEPTSIPIWLMALGVGVGILHIVVFVIILKKCGFFRRKQYERMQDEMRENRIEQVMSSDPEAEQQEAASQYDNELLREQVSLKSQSQQSAVSSYGNVGNEDESKKTNSAVNALLAQHPGIDFTAE